MSTMNPTSLPRKRLSNLLLLLALSTLWWLPAVAPAQVIHQQGFDIASDIDLWSVISPTFSSRVHEPNEDALGNPASGSMRIANSQGTVAFGTAQFQLCIDPALPGQAFQAQLAARIPLGQTESGRVSMTMTALDQGSCLGNSLGVLANSALLTTASNSWTALLASGNSAPAGTQSVFVRVLLVKTEDHGILEALIDDVLVERIDLFADGFESGNTSLWSSTIP